jgi:uncharacterized membrane protein YgcG
MALWACSASLPGPRICSGRAPCDEDRSCVLGRCRDAGTMPISTDAPRLTFAPADLAYIADGLVQGPDQLDETIVLGQRDQPRTLLMRFAVQWPDGERLQRALLVLEPMPRCPRRPGRLRLSLAHLTEPWTSKGLSLGRLPDRSLPMSAGSIGATPAQPLRLDVTEIVRAWDAHDKRYHGLALSAEGDSDSGACFTTGLTVGHGPRLEVYLWPDEDAGKGGAGGSEGAGGAGGAGGVGGAGGSGGDAP